MAAAPLAGRVGYDRRENGHRIGQKAARLGSSRRSTVPRGGTNGGTYKVCTPKRIAQRGGKAHGALLNCSPNDRRPSVRLRPLSLRIYRNQPVMLRASPLMRLQVSAAAEWPASTKAGEVGRFARAQSQTNRTRQRRASWANCSAPTIVGGNTCRLRRSTRGEQHCAPTRRGQPQREEEGGLRGRTKKRAATKRPPAGVAGRRLRVRETDEFAKLSFEQGIGLFALGKHGSADEERAGEFGQYLFASPPTGLVAVKKEGDETGTAMH